MTTSKLASRLGRWLAVGCLALASAGPLQAADLPPAQQQAERQGDHGHEQAAGLAVTGQQPGQPEAAQQQAELPGGEVLGPQVHDKGVEHADEHQQQPEQAFHAALLTSR